MSVIREVTADSLTDAWRTINIDALQEDSSVNFDTSTLHPPLPEVGEADVRELAGQIRQLLRGGDSEGALRSCLEFPVYNGADSAKVRLVCHDHEKDSAGYHGDVRRLGGGEKGGGNAGGERERAIYKV